MSLRITQTAIFALVLSASLVSVPLLARADESADLRAAIMTELFRDPRTASVPTEQLTALVDALSEEVQKQSITSADILWHPEEFWQANTAAQAAAQFFPRACDQEFAILCPFNQAFGFAGLDSNLPEWLFILSAVLLLLLPRVRKELESDHAAMQRA